MAARCGRDWQGLLSDRGKFRKLWDFSLIVLGGLSGAFHKGWGLDYFGFLLGKGMIVRRQGYMVGNIHTSSRR